MRSWRNVQTLDGLVHNSWLFAEGTQLRTSCALQWYAAIEKSFWTETGAPVTCLKCLAQ